MLGGVAAEEKEAGSFVIPLQVFCHAPDRRFFRAVLRRIEFLGVLDLHAEGSTPDG